MSIDKIPSLIEGEKNQIVELNQRISEKKKTIRELEMDIRKMEAGILTSNGKILAYQNVLSIVNSGKEKDGEDDK